MLDEDERYAAERTLVGVLGWWRSRIVLRPEKQDARRPELLIPNEGAGYMIKTLAAQLASTIGKENSRRDLQVLGRFFVVLSALVIVYSVLFHILMLREGQHHTWITGFYWTLTVMSTLGFGDITFHTDLGRIFSIVVLLTGTIFLLVLLPFTFIQFFYEPWMKAQAAARTPRRLSPNTRDHVLLTSHDPLSIALIRRLEKYSYEYVLLVSDVEEALRLHDRGLNVLVGDLDDPETWKHARVESAALVASTATDVINTSVAFTVRQAATQVPIVTLASDVASVDIMKLAGSNFVIRLEDIMGQSFARRSVGGDAVSHTIGQFDELLIAEASAHRTPMVGKTLQENGLLLREIGVTVVGVWERGRFEPARAETKIAEHTVLLLAGSQQHMRAYDEFFCLYNVSTTPVVILGGGRVGRATAAVLASREVEYRIVEILPERIRDPKYYVQGNAADLAVLEAAGIRETSTVIVTTGDDKMNVYLTIYCRQLRPDIQIMSRATNEQTVATLHRAGADSVLSYGSTGANLMMNYLRRGQILMVAEGLYLFEVDVPAKLAGSTIAECSVRQRTGCSVVAIRTESGFEPVPSPAVQLSADASIVLIGTAEDEQSFLSTYN